MRPDKSKSQILKLNSTNQTFKKQKSIQRDATKKYLEFKKSASQPAYFLNKSRLKKISDIYRAVSLQKLGKNLTFSKSKSLHSSITPEKKNSFYNNGTFKKGSGLNTLNLNRLFENNEKTKRLQLSKPSYQNHSHNNAMDSTIVNGNKFLIHQIQKLEEISHLTIQKAFVGQYELFFRSLKQDFTGRKGSNSQIKSLISKFCSMLELCQQKILKINQKQIKSRYDKIQIDFSSTHAQLKKKTFKMQLLIKEINQLKDRNIKISQEISEIRQQRKTQNCSEKHSHQKGSFQINNIIELRINENLAEIKTPIYEKNFSSQSQQPSNQIIYQKQILSNTKKGFSDPLKPQTNLNQRLQMIKKIRNLQKKQKDLMKTLLVLKSDGIDVQKAFQQVITGQLQDIDLEQNVLDLKVNKLPNYIKKMKNKDSFQADESIIESIEGLTVRYFDGQPEQEYVLYPIKNEYKSKPLSQQLQNKLKLDFDILYEDVQCNDNSQIPDIQYQDPPTI